MVKNPSGRAIRVSFAVLRFFLMLVTEYKYLYHNFTGLYFNNIS